MVCGASSMVSKKWKKKKNVYRMRRLYDYYELKNDLFVKISTRIFFIQLHLHGNNLFTSVNVFFFFCFFMVGNRNNNMKVAYSNFNLQLNK